MARLRIQFKFWHTQKKSKLADGVGFTSLTGDERLLVLQQFDCSSAALNPELLQQCLPGFRDTVVTSTPTTHPHHQRCKQK